MGIPPWEGNSGVGGFGSQKYSSTHQSSDVVNTGHGHREELSEDEKENQKHEGVSSGTGDSTGYNGIFGNNDEGINEGTTKLSIAKFKNIQGEVLSILDENREVGSSGEAKNRTKEPPIVKIGKEVFIINRHFA